MLSIWNIIRTLRIAVLNVDMHFVIPVLIDDHRPEDLLLIPSLMLLTVPMIRGRHTHLSKDRLLFDIGPSAKDAEILLLLLVHPFGPKAVITVASSRVQESRVVV